MGTNDFFILVKKGPHFLYLLKAICKPCQGKLIRIDKGERNNSFDLEQILHNIETLGQVSPDSGYFQIQADTPSPEIVKSHAIIIKKTH